MKKPVSASKPKTDGVYSVNALSKMTGRDRRTIDKALVGIEPVKTEGRTKFYRLADVEKTLSEKADKGLKEQKLQEEIRKLRLRNDREEGKLVLRSSVASAIQRCLGRLPGMLEQRLCNEWPTAVAGMDPAQCRIYGKRLVDAVLADFQGLAEEFPA